ncbi:hypothetical protein AVL50_19805 [Flammeovirga sp. SJP92]|nr:hypothetical protein AVL50_19805 [Flammeovirga sp. SJP92]
MKNYGIQHTSEKEFFSEMTILDNPDFYKYSDYIKTADSLKTKLWYKADFDRDGLTDLFVLGENQSTINSVALVFFPKKNGEIIFRKIDLWQYQSWIKEGKRLKLVNNNIFPRIIKTDSSDLLEFNVARLDSINRQEYELSSTVLTYKFGGFIEYNNNQETSKPKVRLLKFRNSFSFPLLDAEEFVLKVNDNGEVNCEFFYSFFRKNYSYYIYKKQLKGDLKDNLFGLLNYIDYNKIKDKYSCVYTDLNFYWVTLDFSSDETRKISDYGSSGTQSLLRLYELVENIISENNWEKVDKPSEKK